MPNQIDFKSFFLLLFFGGIVAFLIGHYSAVYFYLDKQNIASTFNYDSIFLLYHLLAKYGAIAKIAMNIKLFIALGYLPLLVWTGLLVMTYFMNQRSLHGDAKFANKAEIIKAGYLPKKNAKHKYPALLIGKLDGKFLQYVSNQFLSVAAPTRSGKGVGIVIPNLLNYPHSAVVFDVKYENFDITSGFRAKYTKVFKFAPTASDFKTHRYNPLDYIRRGDDKHYYTVADIQDIGKILYPFIPNQDTFWADTAQTLFLGMVLYLIETNKPVNLANLLKHSTPEDGTPLNDWIIKEINYHKEQGKPLSLDCRNALMSFASNSDNTRSSILTTFVSPLNIFRDPVVAAATSASDFRLDEVRKKKMTIYVCINVGDIEKCSKLMNMFFSQLIDQNTKVLPEKDPTLKYQCLLLLDEFTSLGYMGVIEKGVTFIAGYGLRLLIIFQNRTQLKIPYEKAADTILTNMDHKVVFAPNELSDAKDYSELLGYQTVKSKSRSNNSKGGNSTSISDQKRALMLPQELREMSKEDQIITYTSGKPIYCKKIVYHEDMALKDRANLPVPNIPRLNVDENKPVLTTNIIERELEADELSSTDYDSRVNNKEVLKVLYAMSGVVEDKEMEVF